MPTNSTHKKYICIYCIGHVGRIGKHSAVPCDPCASTGKLTWKQLKKHIIELVPDNLIAIEMIERYELNS